VQAAGPIQMMDDAKL